MKKRVKKIQLDPVKLRAVWTIKPITRVKPSAKIYSRKSNRETGEE